MRRRSCMRGSRSGSTRGSPARPAPDACTKRICGCAPTAPRDCSCRASRRSRRYQREQAWTWEHQALTRARFVAGDARHRRRVRSDARSGVAPSARSGEARSRCRRHAQREWRPSTPIARRSSTSSTTPAAWSTSSSPCSIIVLAHAHAHRATDAQRRQHRACCRWPRTRGCSRRYLPRSAADAYRDYRRLQHQIRLTGAPHARVDPAPQAVTT